MGKDVAEPCDYVLWSISSVTSYSEPEPDSCGRRAFWVSIATIGSNRVERRLVDMQLFVVQEVDRDLPFGHGLGHEGDMMIRHRSSEIVY